MLHIQQVMYIYIYICILCIYILNIYRYICILYVCIYIYIPYIYIHTIYVHIYVYIYIILKLVCTYLYTCFMIIYVKDSQYICRCIHAHVFLVMQARKVNYTVAFWLIPGVFLNGFFYVCTQIII